MKKQEMKVWQTPRLIIFNTNQITSGNPADPRRGEFAAEDGTGCPPSIVNATCITGMEPYILTYSTGRTDYQVICQNDPRTMTYYIPICS